MVPGEAEWWLDIRTIPGTDHEALVSQLEELMQKMMPVGASVEVSIENERPAIALDPEGTLAGVSKRIVERHLDRPVKLIGASYFSDASILSRDNRYDVLMLGPGEPDVAHTRDEWVSVDAVRLATEMYGELLDALNP
jgi:succinyl-diaminopimelate desuccinylase